MTPFEDPPPVLATKDQPKPPPRALPNSLSARVWRGIGGLWLKAFGWRTEGEFPPERKFIIVAAPHTSNWDLPFLLACATQFGVTTHWFGKTTIFKWPFGGLMRRLGGIPIDRSKSTNMVAQSIAEFDRRENFSITVAPAGTRGNKVEWKSGFYHIAHGAGVPLVLGFLDYQRKVGGVGPTIWTTGDLEADMVKIRAFYAGISGKNPNK